MNLGIKGKRALITGATRGIGKAIACALSEEGAEILITGRNHEKFEGVHGVTLDLTDSSSLESAIEKIKDFSPDIIVHNAGGSCGVTSPFATQKEWKKVWDTNLGGSLEINNSCIPLMTEKKWGRIIYISSISTQNYTGYAPYVSAKMALDGYIKSMSKVVAKQGVLIAGVAPGPIAVEDKYLTRLSKENEKDFSSYCDHYLPIGRLGTKEEVAAAVCFLCSEHSGFASGSIFEMSGGSI